jgi:hypothetical protein
VRPSCCSDPFSQVGRAQAHAALHSCCPMLLMHHLKDFFASTALLRLLPCFWFFGPSAPVLVLPNLNNSLPVHCLNRSCTGTAPPQQLTSGTCLERSYTSTTSPQQNSYLLVMLCVNRICKSAALPEMFPYFWCITKGCTFALAQEFQ